MRNQREILEKGEGADEVENLCISEGSGNQSERPDDDGDSTYEIDLVAVHTGIHVQMNEIGKGEKRVENFSSDALGITD